MLLPKWEEYEQKYRILITKLLSLPVLNSHKVGETRQEERESRRKLYKKIKLTNGY